MFPKSGDFGLRTLTCQQKPPVHKWDGREVPVVPPKFPALAIQGSRDTLCRLTSASHVTLRKRYKLIIWAQNIALLRSLVRLKRELRLVSVECGFQQFYHISLAASASLLSSVTAFILGSPVTLYYLRKRDDVKAWISVLVNEEGTGVKRSVSSGLRCSVRGESARSSPGSPLQSLPIEIYPLMRVESLPSHSCQNCDLPVAA